MYKYVETGQYPLNFYFKVFIYVYVCVCLWVWHIYVSDHVDQKKALIPYSWDRRPSWGTWYDVGNCTWFSRSQQALITTELSPAPETIYSWMARVTEERWEEVKTFLEYKCKWKHNLLVSTLGNIAKAKREAYNCECLDKKKSDHS